MSGTQRWSNRLQRVREYLQSPLVKGILLAMAIFGVSRLLTLMIAYAISLTRPSGSILRILSSWDGQWYLSIVRRGYATDVPLLRGKAGQNNIAFFPGLPVAIAGVSRATGLAPRLAGVVMNPIVGAVAAAAVWVLANRFAGGEVATKTATLFSFYPAAFAMSMVYPESLFILFVAICLLALLKDQWLLASLSASVAGLVRPNGIVLALSCAWAAGVAMRRGSRLAIVAPLLASLGPLVHMAYLYAHTGDPLAFFHVEDRAWDQRFDFGLTNLRRFVNGFHSLSVKVLIVGLSVIAGVLAIYLIIRWRPPAVITIYLAGILGLTLLSTATNSLPRYLLGAFPILIPLARAIPDRLFPAVVGSSATLMAVLFYLTGTTRLPP